MKPQELGTLLVSVPRNSELEAPYLSYLAQPQGSFLTEHYKLV